MQKLLELLNRAEAFSKKQRERARERRKRPMSPFGVGYGSFHERMIAAMVDLLLVSFVTTPLMQPPINAEVWAMNSLVQAVVIGTYCLTWWYFYAATPGKMIFRLHIVDMKTGLPIKRPQAMKRIVAYVLSTVSIIGIFWMLWNKDRRCLHDLIAETAVVKRPKTSLRGGETDAAIQP